MAECHRYPLRVQQSKLDGWWLIFVDEVPGLGVWGPNYEDLLDRLKVAAGNVFRARGETVTDIKIIPSKRPALQVTLGLASDGAEHQSHCKPQTRSPCPRRESATSKESITNSARCSLDFLSNQVH